MTVSFSCVFPGYRELLVSLYTNNFFAPAFVWAAQREMAEKPGEVSDTGDELAGDQQNLVESDDSDEGQAYNRSRSHKRKKYTVSSESKTFKYLPKWCQPENLSRNERICLVAGIIAVVAIIVVFVTIAVTASPVTRKGGGDNGEAQGTDENGTDVKWSDVRLQSSITPNIYNIAISVDLDSFLVAGSVSIDCSVTSNVEYIAVHVKDMDISSDGHTLVRNDKEIKHNEVWYKENDFFIFNLSQPLSPGSVTIYMKFNYTLRKDLAGFYRSSYNTAAGATGYLATTQFEPTDARRAFPCFDEPAMKANFSMQLTHHSNYSAWSNMPLTSRSGKDSKGFVTSKFQTSVRMSSYLVAFIVSDFECVEGNITSTSGNEVMVRVCSNPVVKSHTYYALEVAKSVIMFYEQEFGVPYPLPKQDLFAIPDFAVGAMENWGLITYRETALLYNGETDPAASKQRVAVVIAHELAHQWFGNLVTMAWWDGLWLNEGFASFMEYLGTNNYEPSFHMMQQFFSSDFALALNLDGLNESHPILQEVASPDEINSLFDSISYSKGASIIRMLKFYIGEEAFRNGITDYLQAHKYGNAETYELWESLQKTSGNTPTVTEVMDTWTKQMGYPVFTVSRSKGTLTQTRFFSVTPEDRSTIAPSPYNYVWKAPFNYVTFTGSGGSATNVNLGLVTTTSKTVAWPTNVLIKANVNQTAFYRVNYELSDWLDLAAYLLNNVGTSGDVLSPTDRAGLLDDVFALSSAGMLDIRLAFNFSRFLVKEKEFLPWSVALTWFARLDGMLNLSPKYGIYKDIVGTYLSTIDGQFSTETPSSELSHLEIFLRSAILTTSAKYGNKEVIDNGTELFKAWKTANMSIDPNLKSLVYGLGIAYGNEEDWNYVWNSYLQSQDPYEKRLFLIALAESSELWILNRYLNYSLTKVRSQDSLSVIVYVSRNIHGRYLAWNFVRANSDYILKVYGQGSFFSRFVIYITRNFATEFELQELMNWYSSLNTGTAERGFRQAIEVVRGNIAWLNTF